MEELEERLQAVLNDPEQMQQIFALAQSLGLSPPDGASEEGSGDVPPIPPVSALSALPVAQLLQQVGHLEKRQENLLNAIKPFLKPARREKIDRAMQVARLSHLAGFALRSRGESKP